MAGKYIVTADEGDEEEDMHDCLVSKAISKIAVPDGMTYMGDLTDLHW